MSVTNYTSAFLGLRINLVTFGANSYGLVKLLAREGHNVFGTVSTEYLSTASAKKGEKRMVEIDSHSNRYTMDQ